MAADWLKLHVEILDNPKVMGLGAETFRFWILLLAMVRRSRSSGVIPPLANLAFVQRSPLVAVEDFLRQLEAAGLVERDGERMKIHDWTDWQTMEAESTERVRQWRNRRKPQSDGTETDVTNETNCNVTVTVKRAEENRGEENRGEENRGEYINPSSANAEGAILSVDKPEPQPSPSRPAYTATFERWYASYPRKIGKQAASAALGRALARIESTRNFDKSAALDWLISVTAAFAKSPAGCAGEFTPHPSTWLSQGRYDDDPAEWQKSRATSSKTTNGRQLSPDEQHLENLRKRSDEHARRFGRTPSDNRPAGGTNTPPDRT